MNKSPVLMEDYFDPGFKVKPIIIVAAQTLSLFHGNKEEQAWEGCGLAAASQNDIGIVRNFETSYLDYWKSLMDNPYIINLKMEGDDLGKYLTEVILENQEIVNQIKENMSISSKLMVFLPTLLEQKLAEKLGIPLHGAPEINDLYGTKSGIRKLSTQYNIPMAPGFICSTISQIEEAVAILSKSFNTIVIKHDTSLSGYFSKKLDIDKITDLKKEIDFVAGGEFIAGKDIVVVEGWLKIKVSLSAHIEIIQGQKPIICAGWQQIIDPSDGVSYMGAGPLMLSDKALESFQEQLNKIANALYEKGAVGLYGPDFMIVDKGETDLAEDICVLTELNARVPYTAFPLEIIKQVKGTIGNGFLAKHIRLSDPKSISDILQILDREKLLITQKNKNAKGVVPYNVGLLPWGLFDIVAIADSWEEVLPIIQKIDNIFQQDKKISSCP